MEKNETAINMYGMNNPIAHSLGTRRRESCNKMADFGRFGVEEHRHSETISEKGYLDRSTRRRSAGSKVRF